MKTPKKTPKMSSYYIKGWKGLAAYTGYHWKTLQRWHYERARVPFIRLLQHTTRSRWVITPDKVHIWMKSVGSKSY